MADRLLQAASHNAERRWTQRADATATRQLAKVLLSLGRLYEAQGDSHAAISAWTRAADLTTPLAASSPTLGNLHVNAMALLYLERKGAAGPIVARLFDAGWRQPDFLDACRRLELEIGGG